MRTLLFLIVSVATAFAQPYLIAHRGGIVDERYAENSPAAVEAAIVRGYWMVEVDIRVSKDGKLVIQHDSDFKRFYNDPRLVRDLTWAQIAQLKSTPGGTRPMQFAELAKLCKGRMRLMLDTKEGPYPPGFFATMLDELQKNDLLDSALVIGTEEARKWFLGKAKVGADRKTIREAETRGEPVAQQYFLFEHGNELDLATTRWAQSKKILIVPSVNLFHYANEDPMKGAERDINNELQ